MYVLHDFLNAMPEKRFQGTAKLNTEVMLYLLISFTNNITQPVD